MNEEQEKKLRNIRVLLKKEYEMEQYELEIEDDKIIILIFDSAERKTVELVKYQLLQELERIIMSDKILLNTGARINLEKEVFADLEIILHL